MANKLLLCGFTIAVQHCSEVFTAATTYPELQLRIVDSNTTTTYQSGILVASFENLLHMHLKATVPGDGNYSFKFGNYKYNSC